MFEQLVGMLLKRGGKNWHVAYGKCVVVKWSQYASSIGFEFIEEEGVVGLCCFLMIK